MTKPAPKGVKTENIMYEIDDRLFIVGMCLIGLMGGVVTIFYNTWIGLIGLIGYALLILKGKLKWKVTPP